VDLELSYTEENYLKAIYHLSNGGASGVSTNSLADTMQTKPATVSDMLRKLSGKKLIDYEKYKGVNISEQGQQHALQIIRKHRLWEVFLVDILHFNWDEVHEIAEQLEHIKSPQLVEKLDAFLGYPTMDPHGDPIPDTHGHFNVGPTSPMSAFLVGEKGVLTCVVSDDPRLLQYLDKLQIRLGTKMKILEKEEFDGSVKVEVENGEILYLSSQTVNQLSLTKFA